MLAVLRLGAAHLPLDLTHPVAHRDGMPADAAATTLVTTEQAGGITVASRSTWRDGTPQPPPVPPGHQGLGNIAAAADDLAQTQHRWDLAEELHPDLNAVTVGESKARHATVR